MSGDQMDSMRDALKDRGVRYLVPSYVDMHGIPKTKMVPSAYLENVGRLGAVYWCGAGWCAAKYG